MIETLRWALEAPTLRAAIWRVLYAIDYSTGLRRLKGNRRP